MPTLVKLGPADHGRPLSLEEFDQGDYVEGYRYELIEGRLYVVTTPNQPHSWAKWFLLRPLLAYVALRPDVINHVTDDARVFVPEALAVTCPEPDLVAYKDFPTDRQPDVQWQDVSPVLAAEILSPDDPDKDLVRNRDLYLRVPSIKEYWVLDILADAARPTLLVFRRHGRRWRELKFEFGSTYTTRLLPDFSLVIDPRR